MGQIRSKVDHIPAYARVIQVWHEPLEWHCRRPHAFDIARMRSCPLQLKQELAEKLTHLASTLPGFIPPAHLNAWLEYINFNVREIMYDLFSKPKCTPNSKALTVETVEQIRVRNRSMKSLRRLNDCVLTDQYAWAFLCLNRVLNNNVMVATHHYAVAHSSLFVQSIRADLKYVAHSKLCKYVSGCIVHDK